MQQWHKANYFYFDFFLICGNLRRFVEFPYKLLNVADVIIMHSVPMSLLCLAWKKQSNLCPVLNVSLGCPWFYETNLNFHLFFDNFVFWVKSNMAVKMDSSLSWMASLAPSSATIHNRPLIRGKIFSKYCNTAKIQGGLPSSPPPHCLYVRGLNSGDLRLKRTKETLRYQTSILYSP